MEAEGPNYRIHVDAGIAWCAVWRRPDVDAATGATFANALAEDMSRIAADPHVIGAVLDQREAPPVAGPATREILGRILVRFASKHRRSAFVVSGHATQRLQLAAIAQDFAPGLAAVCSLTEEAEAWIRRGEAPPSSPPRRNGVR